MVVAAAETSDVEHRHVVAVAADEQAERILIQVTGKVLEVVEVNTGDDGDDKDEPSYWNEADNFAEAKSSVAVQGTIALDDGGMDDETDGVMGNPNVGRGNSLMHDKDSLAANLISRQII